MATSGRRSRSREVDERGVALLLFAPAVALQLDVEPAGEDAASRSSSLARGVEAAVGESAAPPATRRRRSSVQPLGVRRHLLERHRGLALRLPERAGGDQAAEVLVAGAVLDEQGEARTLRQCRLPSAVCLRFLPPASCLLPPRASPPPPRAPGSPLPSPPSRTAARRRRRCGRRARRSGSRARGFRGEVLGQRRRVEEGEGRGRAHLGVGSRRRARSQRQRGARIIALSQLLLARPRGDDELQGIGGLVPPAAARVAHTQVARGGHLGRTVRRPALLGHEER